MGDEKINVAGMIRQYRAATATGPESYTFYAETADALELLAAEVKAWRDPTGLPKMRENQINAARAATDARLSLAPALDDKEDNKHEGE